MCIFCDIANHTSPADIVYEDENVICFFPIEPEAYGHILVVPKKHHETIFDICSEDLLNLMSVIKFLSTKLKLQFGFSGINILHASGKDTGQSVFHFHFHILPRQENDNINAWPDLDLVEFDKKGFVKELWK
ncbi:MAG: HIT family protein [Alphaproteobacteria bacterium]